MLIKIDTQTKTETRIHRTPFVLLVTNSEGSLIVEYSTIELPLRHLHREAFGEALQIVGERGWNPAECYFDVGRIVEGNGKPQRGWWEIVDHMEYAQALAIAVGTKVYDAPSAMKEQAKADCGWAEPACNTGACMAGPSNKTNPQAGRPEEFGEVREVLEQLFGVKKPA